MFLELRHFRLLATVADAGSLAAASVRLHLTPSALSHQLRDAEERLGVRLFQRRNRRLVLTDAGERLVEAARRVLAIVAHTESTLRQGAPEEILRFSTDCYAAYGWLPPVLRKWQSVHPRAELSVVLEATRQPIPALLAGNLDLAVMTDAPSMARLSASPLFMDEFLLLVPAGHRFANRAWVAAEDLAEEHVLTYDAPRQQLDVFTRVLWPAGVEPKRHTRVPITEALIDLVRAESGVATLPNWVLPEPLNGIRTVRMTKTGIRRQWQAVRLAGIPAKPYLTDFVRALRDYVSEMAAIQPRTRPKVSQRTG